MGRDIVHVRSMCCPFVPVTLILHDIVPEIFYKDSVTTFKATVRLWVERGHLNLRDLQQFANIRELFIQKIGPLVSLNNFGNSILQHNILHKLVHYGLRVLLRNGNCGHKFC